MAMRDILRKMFSNARESFDEFGDPLQQETLEDKLLAKHLERERRKRVRKALQHFEKKSFREMTSTRMDYHDKFDRLNRVKKKKRRRR